MPVIFFNGCISVGQGMVGHTISEEAGVASPLLVKEKELDGYVLHAEYPEAYVNRESKFVLDLNSNNLSTPPEDLEMTMVIQKRGDKSPSSSSTRIAEAPVQPASGRRVFYYRFTEQGWYTITFELSEPRGDQSVTLATLSADRYVGARVGDGYHHDSFYHSPWFLGGTAVMLGMMVWMMSL